MGEISVFHAAYLIVSMAKNVTYNELRKLIREELSKAYEERETVPAWASDSEKEVEKELKGKITASPDARAKFPAETKMKLVKDELRKLGYGQTREQMRTITSMLPGWVADTDPVQAFLKSPHEMAAEFAEEFFS